MGACCSTADDTAGSKAPVRPAPHDSAKYSNGQYHHAKATAAGAGTTAATTNKNTLGAKQQQQQQQLRNSRRAKIDLATGEVIPDFSVQGSFDVLHELGSGGSGRTFLCRDMATGKVVAVKFVPRPLSKAAIPFMLNEVEVQANLGEPCLNIVYLYEIILTRTHLALVMEYASGGCLTNEVSCLWESALSRGGLFMSEQEASYYMRQFVQAMVFCHKNKVAHRDLKLDNTLLEKQLVGPHRIKLCDFGFAKQWSGSNPNMDTAIGTPVYMSPQMLASRQCASGYSGEKADIWAAGILLFVMLLGTFPFDHDLKHDPNSREAAGEVWLKQQQGSWRQHPKAADVVNRGALSADCCQLLDQLLEMDEEKRISTSQLVHHPWLSLPLSPEQQLAWEALQDEQQKLTDQLEAERDPRLVKMRKEAMLAMMAVAAKAPSATLFPGPNGEYASSHHSTGMGQPTALGSAVGSAPICPAYSQLLDDAGCPDQAADHAADQYHHQQGADIPPGSPSQHSHKQQSELMVNRTNVPDTSAAVMPAASAFAAARAAEAADVPEEYEGWDDTTAVSDTVGSLTSLAGDSRHLSFFSGQGLRSTSLEEKVDRYRQQSADIRAARIAAMAEATAAGSQTQQQSPGADPKLPPAGNCASDTVRGADSGHNAGGCAADGTTSMTGEPQVSPHAPDTVAGKPHRNVLKNWKRKHDTVSSEASNEQQCGQREGSASNSPSTVDLAAASTGNAVGGAAAGAVAQEDVDELWRLPLSTTVDPSVFKLSPELVVAAGALIRQLQGSSKIPGRGRTNRSSCPM